MTIAEIATQIGVTPETLVQEVIARGTAKATAFVVLGALAIVLAVMVLVAGTAYHGCELCIPFAVFFCAIGIYLLANVPDLVAWKTAPETTATQYIVEHYGGTEK